MKQNKGKRNLVEEIKELKDRHGGYYSLPLINSWQSAVYEIEQLQAAFHWGRTQAGSFEAEQLLKYIPVGLVATIEVFFGNVIGQLIDFGSPYIERVARLKKYTEIQFDVDYMIAIPQKRVSVGEFVSHQLKINNLNSILAYMSAIIENDPLKDKDDPNYNAKKQGFWKRLKEVADRESSEIILKDSDKAFQSIEEMFRMRHIIAHETGFYVSSKFSKMEEGLKDTLDFINATGEFAAQLMKLPVTIDEKVKYAEDKLAALQEELKILTEKFRDKLKSDSVLEMMLDNFEKEQVAWDTLISQQGFEGYLIGGTGGVKGHGNDLASIDADTYLTQVRVNSLKFRLSGDRSYRQ